MTKESSPVLLALGALLGVALAIAGIGCLFWTEGKAIRTARDLELGSADARTVAAERVDPANDGKLVHLTGEAVTSETLTDPEFGVSAKAARLTREVELNQWEETKSEKKKDKNTTVTYKYNLIWSKKKPATNFTEKAGHVNPADKPYADAKLNAKDVKVGAFALTPGQVERLPADENLPVTADMLAKLPDDLQERAKIDAEGRLFVAAKPGGSPDDPRAGDIRIRFKVFKPQTVSVVAKQAGNSFEPPPPDGGADMLKVGSHSAQSLFETAQTSNRLVGWVFRVVAFLLLAPGVFLLLRRQLAAASGGLPEGAGFNVSLALVAVVVAVALMLLVIGGRWLLYQSGFGGGTLAAGLLTLGGLFLVLRGRKSGPFAALFGGGKTWSPKEREDLRGLALNPENAELRKAFAAGLEKKGDPQGEFIRIDTELEALPENDPRREPLDERWGTLLQEHGREWFQPLRGLRLEPEIAGTFFPALWMHHGIIDEVLIDRAGILPQKAEQLFAAAPGLRVIAFHNIRMEPGLGGLKDVRYDPDVPAIVRVPHLSQIGALKMSGLSLKLSDLEAIASSPYLENLTELDFSYNRVGPRGATVLATSATLKRLRVLELRSCEIGEEGAVGLTGSANLARLTELNLGDNAIGQRGAAALAGSAHLKNLQILALDANDLGPTGAQTLAGSPNLAKLTTLKINDNHIGGAGARHLAGSPHLGRLQILELDTNEIDDAGIVALAASGAMGQLVELSLSYNSIGDAGFKALASCAGLVRLTKLNLRQNQSGPVGVAALAASPYLRGLKQLDVSNNNVGLAGAQALAASPVLGSLETLWVYEANITPEGENVLRQRFKDALHVT